MSLQDEKPAKKKNKLLIVITIILATVCCVIGAVANLFGGSDPTPTVELRAATLAIATDAPTDAPIVPSETAVLLPTETATQPPTETAIPAPTIQPATETQITGIQLVSLSETVYAGGDANLSILTTPGLACHISYTTPSGNLSEADGLGTTIADNNGRCGWVWRIGFNTAPGTGSVLVTAGEYSQTWEIMIK